MWVNAYYLQHYYWTCWLLEFRNGTPITYSVAGYSLELHKIKWSITFCAINISSKCYAWHKKLFWHKSSLITKKFNNVMSKTTLNCFNVCNICISWPTLVELDSWSALESLFWVTTNRCCSALTFALVWAHLLLCLLKSLGYLKVLLQSLQVVLVSILDLNSLLISSLAGILL